MNSMYRIICLSFFVVQYFQWTECWIGDPFPSYQSCVKKCQGDYCRLMAFHSLVWYAGTSICYFLSLNLVSTIYMYRKFYKIIRIASAMYWIWTIHAMVSSNAWFWSVLFHIRDIPFTERMDYIGAASLIYFTFCAFGFRMLIFQNLLAKTVFLGICLFLFVQHILHLIMKPFDYHYNFDTLILIGLITGLGTMIWCLWYWRKTPHVQYAAVYVTLTILVASLEVFDFPPIMWTFDAHSLWHLATIPLPYFIYKFATEDCRYLRRICHQATVSTVG